MTNDETTRLATGRLSLLKGEGRVRVVLDSIVWPEPLTSVLSPPRGEADWLASRARVSRQSSPTTSNF
jgi:hypothetical protein